VASAFESQEYSFEKTQMDVQLKIRKLKDFLETFDEEALQPTALSGSEKHQEAAKHKIP